MSVANAKWIKLSDVAALTQGSLVGKDADLEAVSIDTRKVEVGDLFIAIKGERFDAHDFVAGLNGKVAGALVDKDIQCDVPQVLVADTKQALADLASAWRDQFKKPVIGLTGSNGKTTLKEMLSAILSQVGSHRVLATLGNFNNDIGMPLTLLRIREEHDFAVIEMGANHFDEIDFLTHIAKPDIAVINNAGPAHLEGFGDIEGVAKAKGEIFNSLTEAGIAIINADDDYAGYWRGLNTHRKIIQFGLSKLDTTEVNSVDIKGEYLGGGRLVISANGDKEEVQLNLLGKHNAMNALAATAVSIALSVDLQTVKKGLQSLVSVPGRLALVKGINNCQLLDDTYNANPGSASVAVDVLAEAKGKRILVLGDMGELGDDADSLHADIGAKAKQAGIELMFSLGKDSAHACKKFGNDDNAFNNFDDLVDAIKQEIKSNMTSSLTILIKGSRSAQMERVVEALRDVREAPQEATAC